jgi:hypothetical protein
MKKNIYLYVLLLVSVLLISCSQQRRIANQLSCEWNVDKYEFRSSDGQSMTVENAGTIFLRKDGTGYQRFSANVAQFGHHYEEEFKWHNNRRTIYIHPFNRDMPKVWIVVNARRTQQLWYSTDDQANVQVLHVRRR